LEEFKSWLGAQGDSLQLKKVDLLPTVKGMFEIPDTAFGWKRGLHPRSQANTLHRLFKEYQSSLRSKAKKQGNEVVLFVLSFMDLMQDHGLFEQSIRLGDYVATEYLLVDWLYHWQAAGKYKYVGVTLNAIDTLYGGTKGMLEMICLNKFLRISKGKGFFALDEVCELINLLVKHLPPLQDITRLVLKTSWLQILKHAKNYKYKEDDMFKDPTVNESEDSKEAIFQLLKKV
jgi:hypothetical protein